MSMFFKFDISFGISIDHSKGFLDIGCKNGSIKILEIQREGKRPQKTNEFMLGSKIIKGSNLKDA